LQLAIGKAIKDALSRFLSSPGADQKAVEELVRGIQRGLLMADVEVKLVGQLSDRIRAKALEAKLPPGISRKEQVVKIVYDELAALVGKRPPRIEVGQRKPYVIMLLGIQGTGKTTTAAKLANYFKKNGHSVGVVCADTYRTGAYEQLTQLLQPRGIPVYGEPNGQEAVTIAKRGLEKLSKDGLEVIIIDTAGRHKDQSSLMDEMRSLEAQLKPTETVLVIDGTIGQQAGVHAAAFHQATPVGSIIISKLDTSAKGGGALSAVNATGAQVRFVGLGEGIEDIEPFNPTSYIASLLGMPDIESLLEKVRMAEMEVSEEKVKAFVSGRFTLEDMVNQLKEMRKLGPLKKIISKLPIPGMPDLPEDEVEKAEAKIKKWSAILQSMTPEERKSPGLVDDSRTRRIARGSGTMERDVKELLKQYQMSKRVMKSLRRSQRKLPKQLFQQ